MGENPDLKDKSQVVKEHTLHSIATEEKSDSTAQEGDNPDLEDQFQVAEEPGDDPERARQLQSEASRTPFKDKAEELDDTDDGQEQDGIPDLSTNIRFF